MSSDIGHFAVGSNLVLGLCHAASYGIVLGLAGWLPTVVTGQGGVSNWTSRIVVSLFAFAGVIGRLAGTRGITLFGTRRHVMSSLALLAVGLAVLGYVTQADGLLLNVAVVIFLTGLFANNPFSALMGEPAQRDPRHAGAILGVVNTVALAIAMVLPVGFGWLRDVTGSFVPSHWLYAGVAVIGAVLGSRLPDGRHYAVGG